MGRSVFPLGRSATVAWPSLPDLLLLPGVETKPYGPFRRRALDIEGVGSCWDLKDVQRLIVRALAFLAKMSECISSE